MAKYYFHVLTSEGRVIDPEGTELEGMDAAHVSAIEDARALMSEAILEGKDISSRKIEICDENGALLQVVSFRSALTVVD